jgi:H+/Cl- antiporter ClcA
MTDTNAGRRPLAAGLLAAVIGVVLGTVMLEIVNAGIELMWVHLPAHWSSTPAWYVIAMLLVAAVLVFLIRTHIGDEGHSPIGGITVSPLTPQAYVGVILAILASLFFGIVLGPEVALVSTGSMVGTVMAKSFGITDPKAVTKVVGLGALGGILGLFALPLITGSMKLGETPASIEVDQMAWAIGVALIATIAVTIARLVAALFARAAGRAPHFGILIGSAIVIGVSALLMQALTGESVTNVVTSGEEFITQLPAITSISALVTIIVFKAIAYAVSLGSGFRGGPFFPAMFVGAAVGLVASLALPSGPHPTAAITVGVVAGVIATARMKWPIAIAIGAVIGLLMGTWTLIPAAIVGAIVARAIPRLGDRISTAPEHA